VIKFCSRRTQVAIITAETILHKILKRKIKYITLLILFDLSYLTFVLVGKIVMKEFAGAPASTSPIWIY